MRRCKPTRKSLTAVRRKSCHSTKRHTMSEAPPNAPANLRASQIKCERSELPKMARQVQRTLAGSDRYCSIRVPCAAMHRQSASVCFTQVSVKRSRASRVPLSVLNVMVMTPCITATLP